MKILEDAELRPALFVWNGGVERGRLRSWCERVGIARVPADLEAFWAATGGGDVFETETILGPDEGVLHASERLWRAGFPSSYLVFWSSWSVGAFDAATLAYLDLDPETRSERRIDSFEPGTRPPSDASSARATA